MNETLYIPKRIKIGFNKRSDTYTQKLGFVVYWDDKGVLRQEKSWEGWRDKKIDPMEFDNSPTEGFVLNKGVGGARASWGWNTRNEYVRVYDPRGFEFEISVENLLFILQECTSTKGKGLEGEFVYSWSGKNLVLLPVGSQEYKKSTEFTTNLVGKVDKSMMVPGKSYLFKNTSVAMYLGRYEVNKMNYSKEIFREKKHVFLVEGYSDDKNLNGYLSYESGFTNISKVLTDEISDSFSDLLELFINSEHHQPVKEIEPIVVGTPRKPNEKDWQSMYLGNCLIKVGDTQFRGIRVQQEYASIHNDYRFYLSSYYNYNIGNTTIKQDYIYSNSNSFLYYDPIDPKKKYYTLDEIYDLLNGYTFYKLHFVFENGKKVEYNELNLKR